MTRLERAATFAAYCAILYLTGAVLVGLWRHGLIP